MTKFEHTENKLSEISQGITWDNWIKEVTEVLYCQLDWVKENLPAEDDDNYELHDIIIKVQELLTAMSEDNYENN